MNAQTRSSTMPCSLARLFTLGVASLIWRSRLGFGLRCIEQNEDAAIVLGVNTLALQGRGASRSPR